MPDDPADYRRQAARYLQQAGVVKSGPQYEALMELARSYERLAMIAQGLVPPARDGGES